MSEKQDIKYWFQTEITTRKGEVLLNLKTPYRDYAKEVIEKFGTGENFR